MCGIIGGFTYESINQVLFNGLTMLQHRGQDGAGIATIDGDAIHLRRSAGLVSEVFKEDRDLFRLTGNLGLGHVRYPTAGSSSPTECQPFYVNSPFGLALAHNGTINNAKELREEVRAKGRRHINTDSDSEILLNYLAYCFESILSPSPEDLFAVLKKVYDSCSGGYAVGCLIMGLGFLAFRDPNGIRPLIFGERSSRQGKEYLVASESIALQTNGFVPQRDLEAGEAVFISCDGEIFFHKFKGEKCPCIFEHVYFARPDSVIDNISVHRARQRMGVALSEEVKKALPAGDIDVVIPVPDSSRVAAVELALKLNIHYREGLVKNRYIGRTFIMPRQNIRDISVRRKLSTIDLEFRGKNVLLVDDSIVRGTTCRQIISMARHSGAAKVYFASAAPPVLWPNVYGIDMPSRRELIAADRTEDEICDLIGADGLVYQKLPALIESVQADNREIKNFDCSVFDGKYITGDISEEYLTQLDMTRRDESKTQLEIFDEMASAYY